MGVQDTSTLHCSLCITNIFLDKHVHASNVAIFPSKVQVCQINNIKAFAEMEGNLQ